jgi:hypothetical protein
MWFLRSSAPWCGIGTARDEACKRDCVATALRDATTRSERMTMVASTFDRLAAGWIVALARGVDRDAASIHDRRY